jgi:hypothetical protein
MVPYIQAWPIGIAFRPEIFWALFWPGVQNAWVYDTCLVPSYSRNRSYRISGEKQVMYNFTQIISFRFKWIFTF